jgi:hypothetical protein
MRCQSNNLVEVSKGKGSKDNCPDLTVHHGCECRLEVSVVATFHDENLQPKRLTGL